MTLGTADVIGGLLMAYNPFGGGHISWWFVALPWIIAAVIAGILAGVEG